jgi:hypothetical protein
VPITRVSEPAETVIRLDGAFDCAAAKRLESLVDDVATGVPLTLDFREVRLFHDSAIVWLAAALSRHPGAHLVGLSQHHYRLLRYVADRSALTGS